MQRRWLVLLSLLVVMLWWSALGGAQQPRPDGTLQTWPEETLLVNA